MKQLYKRVVFVCLFIGLLFCFLWASRHLSTLRRCLRVAERAGAVVAGGKRMYSESTRARNLSTTSTTSQRKNRSADAFQKQLPVRARACCRIRNCRDFQKKGKRKPTCHFPSSVYSLPSLGVFTFRIVLNRFLHKSSLLAPMESRRTRRPIFTAEERLERRREQDRRLHAERRARKDGSRHRPGGMWIACGLPKPVPRRLFYKDYNHDCSCKQNYAGCAVSTANHFDQ